MHRQKFLMRVVMTLMLAAVALWALDAVVRAQGQRKTAQQTTTNQKKITPADQRAAAKRAATTKVALTAAPQMATPGSAPHYFTQANWANSPLPSGTIAAFTIAAGGTGYTAPVVTVTDAYGVGTGFTAGAVTLDVTGAITAIAVSNAGVGYLAPVVTITDATGTGAVAYPVFGTVTGGIRKFVDALPNIPAAVPDTTTYPGSDYYEIELGQYTQKMHADLPPTTLRGYRQTNGGDRQFHYLGPIILAQKDRPVRIKFTNNLPAGAGGNLFLPVDTSFMGAGMTAAMNGMAEADPQHPMCGQNPKPAGCYSENRATLHLHGGVTPWISDGTPHQWITPAADGTGYPKGVSVKNVPDMGTGCDADHSGCQTFYYTNQQSARLLFYHDHSWGITRLNVYAGEAAGYVITDPTEQRLITTNVIPGSAQTIPLIIQDKTFVPDTPQLSATDPLWDLTRWGGKGSLWGAHVYMPMQNPADAAGANPFGRWFYGPYFWPPVNPVYGPITNPYYGQADPSTGLADNSPTMPGTPQLSSGMEQFNDTPIVNGAAYPTMTVEPRAYRFRILNAANDRFFNLQLLKAVDAKGVVCDAANTNPAPESTGVACTEVRLDPVLVAAAQSDPPGVFPTPVADPVTGALLDAGPSWIQIGTEGGFLPSPAVIAPQPITWITDPGRFDWGNVDKHSLVVAPAERADVIVDFSQYAGQTLILYNDAPAAFPARDPRYDYYTGNASQMDTGGAPSTLRGYGPNTRTIMRIRISGRAQPGFNLNALQAAFDHHADGSGVFESSQHPIIVGQAAYNSAYGTGFLANGWCNDPQAPSAMCDGFARIQEQGGDPFGFNLLKNAIDVRDGKTTTWIKKQILFEPKAMHDETNAANFDDYGRMQANLGLEAKGATPLVQNVILYPYTDPPTEIIDGSKLPQGDVNVKMLDALPDGTQIWKITHNGVDTHPIHFHLYDVQVINRVTWDQNIMAPDANELGWKDTVRLSPLEDTIVAVRPVIPTLPFDLPNSVRLLNPMMPEGATLGSATNNLATNQGRLPMNPDAEPIDIYNHLVNFGWEYVWHCHILSHEEMDMMRPQIVGMPPKAPSNLAYTMVGNTATFTWKDNSANETAFIVQRAFDPNFTVGLTNVSLDPNVTTYVDKGLSSKQVYYYRVYATNVLGDTWDYSDPALNEIPPGGGFPTLTLDSAASNVMTIGTVPTTAPVAPTNLVAKLQAGPQVQLTWKDNSNNESGFSIERSVNGGAFTVLDFVATNVNSYLDTTAAGGNSYTYRVQAANGKGSSVFTNTSAVTIPAMPAAPSSLFATALQVSNNKDTVTLTWTDNSTNETGFTIDQATDPAFTNIVNTFAAPANGTTTATYTQTGVTRGITYYYRVAAVNLAGTSVYVNTFILTP